MANVLPKKRRNEIKRDFILRLLTVYIFATSIAVLVGAALIVPAFILSKENYNLAKEKESLVSKNTDKESYNKLRAEVRSINARIKRLNTIKDPLVFDAILKVVEIRNKSFQNIKIRGFVYNESGSEHVLRLSGLADGRDYLSDFVDVLETEELFKDVKLPLSSFAKEDAVFSITITL